MNSNTLPNGSFVPNTVTMILAVIGDSFSAIYANAVDGLNYCTENKHWTTLVSLQLGIQVINKGVSGNTTGDMRARFINDILSTKATHCIIEGFTNDVFQRVPYATTMANIDWMVQQCIANGITPILMNALPGFGSYGWYDPSKPYLNYNWETDVTCNLPTLRTMQKNYATANNIAHIDIYSSFMLTSTTQDDSLYIYDDVHPNERGCMNMTVDANKVLIPMIQGG